MANKAVIKVAQGQAVVKDVALPLLRPGYMLVQTHAVALNPADWTDVDYDDYYGCIVGIDYAGVVVDPGDTAFKSGDRVAGLSHGCNKVHPTDGAFAQYISVKGELQMHIPDSISFEAAAAMGTGVISAGMGLFLELELKFGNQGWILIYGGSSATGSIGIQLAKIAGYKVVTTCSPRNFDMVRDRSADVVLDHRDPDVSQAISKYEINRAFDTIATDETAKICVAALQKPAIYVTTLDPALPADAGEVDKRFFLGYNALGEYYEFEGEKMPYSKRDHEFGVKFMKIAEGLIAEGKLKNHPIAVNQGGSGLEGVVEGLKILKAGNVSGTKLVYTLR